MFEIQLDRTQSFPIAKFTGALSAEEAETIEKEIGELAFGENARLAIDLTALRMIDSSGLAALIAIVTRSRLTRGRVVLVAPSPFVAGVLAVTRLDAWFEICPDLDAAEKLLS